MEPDKDQIIHEIERELLRNRILSPFTITIRGGINQGATKEVFEMILRKAKDDRIRVENLIGKELLKKIEQL